MTNDTRLYFKDVKSIIGQKFSYILVSSRLQRERLGDKEAITMVVEMEGFDENNKVMFKVSGCPCPPCKPVSNLGIDLS
jgi:hypothetical protein